MIPLIFIENNVSNKSLGNNEKYNYVATAYKTVWKKDASFNDDKFKKMMKSIALKQNPAEILPTKSRKDFAIYNFMNESADTFGVNKISSNIIYVYDIHNKYIINLQNDKKSIENFRNDLVSNLTKTGKLSHYKYDSNLRNKLKPVLVYFRTEIPEIITTVIEDQVP